MIRIALIGIGDYTEDIIKILLKIGNIKLSYIFDANYEKAMLFKNKHYKMNLKATNNLENIANNSDCVIINSLMPTKVDIIKFFLVKKVNVFAIPPISFNFVDLLNLKEIATSNNVFLSDCPFFINSNWFEDAIKLNISNKILKASFYNNSQKRDELLSNRGVFDNKYDYNLGRGVLFANGYGIVYSAIFLFGKVDKIKAIGHKLSNHSVLDFNAIFKHQNNIISTFDVSEQYCSNNKSLIICENNPFYLINYNILEEFNIKYSSRKFTLTIQTNNDIIETFKTYLKNIKNNDRKFFNSLLNISIETIRCLSLIESEIK
ncbi:Gfo/Idh/MocA family oxidoreductase [Spiroplasma endosymbiont of Aspidapion aeneum]|uniref:Gfo/Idh/MocA family oxidoreductase n=1 Tax=Spiroplasma endosymbiont of Aspidapion aeneum TaxID=3066276 RepID=UPI00313D8013